MKLHREVLAKGQLEALEALAMPASALGFHLAGGTALALRLGHRRSIDLDWFRAERFGDPARLAAALRMAGVPFVATSMAEGTLHGRVEGVETSFLEYPYPRLDKLGRAREGFRLDSLDDIATMKLSAVVDRGSKKDFVDIYALCREHMPLDGLLRLYERRFADAEIGHVLIALSYFDDAERTPMPIMLWDVDWGEVRRDLERRIRALVK